MARVARRRARARRARPCELPPGPPRGACVARGRAPAAGRPDAVREHHPGRPRSRRYPGDEALENRLSSLIRWNAMATVLQANKTSSELGGHIASYQSAATLYEVGFNHFWHAPSAEHGGDLVFFQGHSAPGIYARAFLEGRVTESQLRRFRQEVDDLGRFDGGGISSYPHPWLMPELWQFPTVSMGLGPIMAIYQARFMKYLQGRGIAGHRGPQGLGVPRRRRDRRARVARRDRPRGPRAPRQPRLRRQLQPAAPRRPGPRQRQDHPGARDDLPRRGLERRQGRLGLALGPAARGRPRGPARAADGGGRRRRVPGLQGARRRLRARALLRRRPEAARDGRPHERRGGLGAQPRRPRPARRSTPPTPRPARTPASRR